MGKMPDFGFYYRYRNPSDGKLVSTVEFKKTPDIYLVEKYKINKKLRPKS